MTQCSHCGRELRTHALDISFSLPDVVWALDKGERERRAKFTSGELAGGKQRCAGADRAEIL
jgi:hypothetical protein